MDSLLHIEGLGVRLHTDSGPITAVRNVDISIGTNETVCLVGESGSGKTVTCETVSGLNANHIDSITGTITFDGVDMLTAGANDLQTLRGSRIAHIFQNPEHALDPVYTVGEQIVEAITLNESISSHTARKRAIGLLTRVGISQAAERIDAYPHQFSTGMCQRVAIAIALASEPDLLIADEPTASLDVTVQSRIIQLLASLRESTDMSILLVTHDLRVVAALADSVTVLHEGRSIESGPTDLVFRNPGHPYTQSLFQSASGHPSHNGTKKADTVPTSGCLFTPSCPYKIDTCAEWQPSPAPVTESEDHQAACIHYHPGYEPDTVRRGSSTVTGMSGGETK